MGERFFKYFIECYLMHDSNLVRHDGWKTTMKTIKVLVVRIYIMESSHLLDKVINYLKNEAKIRGISVFRAIGGFGETGNHTASFMDLSLDLPLVIEFFDDETKQPSTKVDGLVLGTGSPTKYRLKPISFQSQSLGSLFLQSDAPNIL